MNLQGSKMTWKLQFNLQIIMSDFFYETLQKKDFKWIQMTSVDLLDT